MEIKYDPSYKNGGTKYICVHNTGGLGIGKYASTQFLKVNNVAIDHKERFNMLSSLGSWVGYNFFIEANGLITQCRAIGEETAAQIGHNFNGETISICLAGNFSKRLLDTIDSPTSEQITALKELYSVLPKVPTANIVPHRFLQNTTNCYGYMEDDWAGKILAPINENYISSLRELIAKLMYLLENIKRQSMTGFGMLKGVTKPCDYIDNRG